MSISVPTPAETPLHPLVAAARELVAVLDSVTGIDPMYASTTDKATLLLELTRIGTRVSALRAGVLAVAADVAEHGIARTPGTWLAHEAHLAPREAIGEERLGAALRHRWHHLAEAVAAGQVTWEQARVLVGCLDDLPTDLDPEVRLKAEAYLVAQAGHFGPVELRRLGRHVLEVVAPAVAEAQQPGGSGGRGTPRPRRDPADVAAVGGRDHRPVRPAPRPRRRPAPGLPGLLHQPPPTQLGIRRGCSPTAAAPGGRRSAPCWSTSPPPGCRSTGGPRPR